MATQPASTYRLRYEIPHFTFQLHEADLITWHPETLEFDATDDAAAQRRKDEFLRVMVAPKSQGSIAPKVISFDKLTPVL